MTLVVVVPAPFQPAADPVRAGAARNQGPRTQAGQRGDPGRRVASSLISSVRAVRGRVPAPEEVAVLDLAEPDADRLPGGAEPVQETSAEAARLAAEVLRWWWNAATRIGQCEGSPADTAAGFDHDAAVRGLGASPYFGSPGTALREARTLGRYLTDQKFRHEARDRTQSAIGPGARVVIGHGLGALVAYEALSALGDAASVTLVTLSAPMCGSDEVFARLEPAPRSGQGHWPASVHRWFNIVAHSDPTAMAAPQLTERFGPGIEDEIIEIRSAAGDIFPYLLDRATGRAIAAGLA